LKRLGFNIIPPLNNEKKSHLREKKVVKWGNAPLRERKVMKNRFKGTKDLQREVLRIKRSENTSGGTRYSGKGAN